MIHVHPPDALRFLALLSPTAPLAPSPALLLGLASRFPEAPPAPLSRPAGRFTGGFFMTSFRVAGRPATTRVPSAEGMWDKLRMNRVHISSIQCHA